MSKRLKEKHSDSEREQQHRAMLKAALARPGIREVMTVYRGWQERDRGLNSYRSATKEARRTTTTNTSNAC